MIEFAINKTNRKLTVYQIQKICGFLNFLCRAIVPGRAFMRRLYSLTAGKNHLQSFHHVRMSLENLEDLKIWQQFLLHPNACYQKFMDFTKLWSASEIDFFSDASKNPKLGFGAKCGQEWLFSAWNEQFILQKDPSIAYLELYALTAAFLV